MAKTTHKFTAATLAALGLSALSPVQLGASVVAAGAAFFSATAAIADGIGSPFGSILPGLGVVIKMKPGNSPIIVPSDANGVVRISGLVPGEYEAVPLSHTSAAKIPKPTKMLVGPDGKLVFAVRRGVSGGPFVQFPYTGSGIGKQAIPEGDNRDAILGLTAKSDVDVNTSSIEGLMKGTLNSREAAAFIVADRAKNGAYKDPQDFANRVCTNVSTDFDLAATQIGNTLIVARGGEPKVAGWKCAVKSGTVELYGVPRRMQFGAKLSF
jgi:hypothetical protein